MKHRRLLPPTMKHRLLWPSLPRPPAKRRRGLAPPPPPAKLGRSLAPLPPPENPQGGLAPPRVFRCGETELILLLFETPSGFALFSYCSVILDQPNGKEVIWTYFTQNWASCRAVWLNDFRTFEDKSSAINQITGVNERLIEMIMKWHSPGQKIAVGKPEYKNIIEDKLKIACLCDPTVMELIWGIQRFMPSSVPGEKSQLTEEDRVPLSKSLQTFLSRYACNVKPEMVNEKIIETAGALFRCESILKRHSMALRSAGELIKNISGINCRQWSLLKIATALKMIWWPEEAGNSCGISKEEVSQLVKHAHLYEIELNKESCLATYKRVRDSHEIKIEKEKLLKLLLEKAKEAYEAEQGKKHKAAAEFINKPIENYREMQIIHGDRLATGKYAKGSSEPIGTAAASMDCDEDDEAVIANNEGTSATKPVKKQKKDPNEEEGLVSILGRVGSELAAAIIRASEKSAPQPPLDEIPDALYETLLGMDGFSEAQIAHYFAFLVENPKSAKAFMKMGHTGQQTWMARYIKKEWKD